MHRYCTSLVKKVFRTFTYCNKKVTNVKQYINMQNYSNY